PLIRTNPSISTLRPYAMPFRAFSAHGVPKSVPAAARARNLFHLDATCPLVSKVHKEAHQHYAQGRELVLIGHAGHPEIIGTMGQDRKSTRLNSSHVKISYAVFF